MTSEPEVDIIPAKGPSTPSFDEQRAEFHHNMLSAVSHDLKTPLASVIGSLEIYQQMQGRLSVEKQQALLNLALQEAYRLDNFITNILDIAKLENGLVKVRYEQRELGELLQEAVDRFVLRDKKQHIRVEMQGEPLIVMADSLLLGRCLQLLVDNAIIHGGGTGEIRLSYQIERAAESFAIIIHDHGQGIPAVDMQHIFSKYTRIGKSDQKLAGTGLGLTICREIMTLLHGTVTAENNTDGGVSVTLRLPLHIANL
jgi:two-component system sensor histidine kinase KdpD